MLPLPSFGAARPGEDVASSPEEVLSHWFSKDIDNADLETLRRQGQRWMGVPEVDREITERFGSVLERALETSTPEERHHVYKLLQLQVVVGPICLWR
jgi:uncharacterized protein (DUF924 family)